jgi:O-antigen ligase
MNNINLLIIFWFFRIFRPEWVISYYIPALAKIRIIPRLLLYLLVLSFILSSVKKKTDTSFFLFVISVAISTFFAHNVAIATGILSAYIDSLLLLILSISLLDSEKAIDKLYNLYLLGFLYYLIFGIFYGGIIPFHPMLGDEDAFGPFMAMGVAMSYFAAFKKTSISYKSLMATMLYAVGVVASFARGAFIGLAVAVMYIWLKYEKKVMATILLFLMSFVIVLASSTFFKDNKYWTEISSIKDTSAETEGDRVFYWAKAIRIFEDNPICGAGPRNYGFVLQRYITPEESFERGMFSGFWYGRVPHSLYFQLLAEQGILGVISFIYVLFIFWKRTIKLQKENILCNTPRQRKLYYYTLGLKGAMLVYLVTGLFYDFLYVSWLVDILVITGLLYNLQKADALTV